MASIHLGNLGAPTTHKVKGFSGLCMLRPMPKLRANIRDKNERKESCHRPSVGGLGAFPSLARVENRERPLATIIPARPAILVVFFTETLRSQVSNIMGRLPKQRTTYKQYCDGVWFEYGKLYGIGLISVVAVNQSGGAAYIL
jgi:hypothetical protein